MKNVQNFSVGRKTQKPKKQNHKKNLKNEKKSHHKWKKHPKTKKTNWNSQPLKAISKENKLYFVSLLSEI